jgi:hypothetical protein
MAQTFRDCCLRLFHDAGPAGLLRLWSLTLSDWLTFIIEQHLLEGVTLRSRVLPYGNYLPILAGVGFPSIAIASLSYEAVNGRTLAFSDLLTSAIFLLTAIGLLALGRILHLASLEPPIPA